MRASISRRTLVEHGLQDAPASRLKGSVSSFVVRSREIYAGTDSGVYHSSDAGAHWEPTGKSWPYPTSAGPLVFLDSSLCTLTPDGFYVSTDGGKSWAVIKDRPSARILVVSGHKLLAGAYDGVYLSSDRGVTWSALTHSVTNINALAVSNDGIFAGTEGGGIYYSPDSGASWTQTNSGLTCLLVHAVAVYGLKVFAGTDGGGVFVSTDNGANWNSANKGLTTPYMNALAKVGSTLLAGTLTAGVYRSSDEGATWSSASTGFPANTSIYSIAARDRELFVGTNIEGVYRSRDCGASWTQLIIGLTSTRVTALGFSDTLVLAGTYGGGIFYSSDYGENWAQATTHFPYDDVGPFVVGPGAVFAGVRDNGVHRSTDNGVSWEPANTGLPSMPDVIALGSIGTSLLVEIAFHGVFRSTNEGQSWMPANAGLDSVRVWSFVVRGKELLAGSDRGIFSWQQDGAGWKATGPAVPSKTMVGELLVDGLNVFAVLTDMVSSSSRLCLWMSGDTSWSDVSMGLPTNGRIGPIAASEGYLYAGVGLSGVWRRPLAEMITSVRRFPHQISGRFQLEQNYPNPFNPSTLICYSLPHRSYVTLTVFNTLGQQVAQLVNADIEAGSHSLRFNAGNLASGVYFYRIQAGSFREVKKMVLAQ